MAHVIGLATSARAKCRGCGERIAKDTVRLGELLPNAYGEGEMTQWFHVPCAAYKRPEVFLEAVEAKESIPDVVALEAAAKRGIEHPRLPRVDGAQRAPTGRSSCRHCRELIDKDAWRIGLVFYQEGRFAPSGYIHVRCAPAYFETPDIMDRVRQFSPALTHADLEKIRGELDLGARTS